MINSLADKLHRYVSRALGRIDEQTTTSDTGDPYTAYLALLAPALTRYHPSDSVRHEEMLQTRFQYETVLLHIITHILATDLCTRGKPQPDIWPVSDGDSPFAWYTLSPDVAESLNTLTANLAGDRLSPTLAQASGNLLNRAGRRYLGEYHTPLPLVEHLIQLSGFQPLDLLHGHRVIDPACGSGIILVRLADMVIQHALSAGMDPAQAVAVISDQLYGFDIQPFATILTRSLLLHTCCAALPPGAVIQQPLFPHVQLCDPLAATEQFWDDGFRFDYIIGNPPFMRVQQQRLDYLARYASVVNGHTNLYQLFLWWAVQVARPGGVVSFLVPQSMLAGSYFERLRDKLSQTTDLLNITRMIDRKGVVGDADLQMMALSLRVAQIQRQHPPITIRVTRNGNDIEQARAAAIPHRRVSQHIAGAHIWVVSDTILDYTIVERLEHQCLRLQDLSDRLALGNGGYVWNEHKPLLRAEPDQNSIPLISAASIQPYHVVFPYHGPHPTHQRQFSRLDDEVARILHSGIAVLVQRTTPRKVGRRLIASLLPPSFCATYPRYFLENHVNYIKPRSPSDSIHYGLTAWLNSDLINFVFQLRNGTTLVSIFELGLLPANIEFLEHLAQQVKALLSNASSELIPHMKQLDHDILDWLELGPKHRQRIYEVLSRKERGGHG